MNGLIRLALDADPKTIISPFESMPDLLEAEQFAASFADAFAAIGDGENEVRFLETAGFENKNPDVLKSDFDIPVAPADGDDAIEVLPAQEVEYETDEFNQPPEKSIDEKPLPEDVIAPVETFQRHAIVRYVQTEPLPVSDRKESRVRLDKVEQTTLRSGDLLRKENAAQHIENAAPKDKQIFLDGGLITPVGKQSESKNGLADEAVISPSRTVTQLSPAPLTALSVTAVAAPTTANSLPNIVPITPTTNPAVPTLNIEMDDQWVAKLSQDIGRLSSDKSALNFQLKPHNLGRLHVEIKTHPAGDVILLETENENAKALIIGSQSRLEQDIRLSGIRLARVDVTVQEQAGSQFEQRGSGAQGSGSEFGQDNANHAQQHLVEQISLPENDTAAVPSRSGTRYA